MYERVYWRSTDTRNQGLKMRMRIWGVGVSPVYLTCLLRHASSHFVGS